MSVPPGAEEVLSPEDLAQKVSYERMKFKPIIPGGVRQAAGVINKEAASEETSTLLRRAGLTPEDIRPGVSPQQVLAEKGIQTGIEKPPISQVMQNALIADTLWKEMGGSRSIGGKKWQEYLEHAPGMIRKNYTTGRDYFISSFNKWRNDPKGFSRTHPREGRILEEVWKTFEDSITQAEASFGSQGPTGVMPKEMGPK